MEYGSECWQKTAAVTYVERRHRCAASILDESRRDALKVDWRDELVDAALLLVPAVPIMQTYVDIDVVVAMEVAGWPRRPWEPYATDGDWRLALEAWYEDRLAVEKVYEEAGRAGLIRLAYASESSWWRDQQRGRDFIGAWYRAGLAAGGEPCDWKSWFKQRIRLREETDPLRIRGRERSLAAVDSEGWMEVLPECWTHTRP